MRSVATKAVSCFHCWMSLRSSPKECVSPSSVTRVASPRPEEPENSAYAEIGAALAKLPPNRQRDIMCRISKALATVDPEAASTASAIILLLDPSARASCSRGAAPYSSHEECHSLSAASVPELTLSAAASASSSLASHNYTGARRPAQQLSSHLDQEGAVLSFAALRNAFSWLTAGTLLRTLLQRQSADGPSARASVQIAYFNSPAFAAPEVFPLLLNFLALTDVWAINLGEIQFTQEQCQLLICALGRSRVGFAFVDAVLVGGEMVRALKDVLKANRERLRLAGDEPWLLSANEAQNRVIRKCDKMWFNARSLKRNEQFESLRRKGSAAPASSSSAAASSSTEGAIKQPPPVALPSASALPYAGPSSPPEELHVVRILLRGAGREAPSTPGGSKQRTLSARKRAEREADEAGGESFCTKRARSAAH